MSLFSTEIDISKLNGTNGFSIINAQNTADRYSVVSGDINNDGIADLIIASPTLLVGAGQIYVIFGTKNLFPAELTTNNLNGTNGFKINGVNINDNAGWSVGSGDINNDEFDDVIINASGIGTSYVVFGQNANFPAEINLNTLNGSNGFRITSTLKSMTGISTGDINGDGIRDVIMGSVIPLAEAGQTYVVFGRNTTFPPEITLDSLNGTIGFKINGINPNDHSGWSVGSGDINNDGCDDVIVGADWALSLAGQTYIVFGSKIPFSSEIALKDLNGVNGFKITGISITGISNGLSGWSVNSGDINGDGIADIVIGAPFFQDIGQGYVVFGGKKTFPSEIALKNLNGVNGFKVTGVSKGDATSNSLSTGDINHDGIDDVIISAVSIAKTYVVFGGKESFLPDLMLNGLDGVNGFKVNGFGFGGSAGSINFGGGVSAGDINGDNIDDIITGAVLNPYAAAVVFGKSTPSFTPSHTSTPSQTDSSSIWSTKSSTMSQTNSFTLSETESSTTSQTLSSTLSEIYFVTSIYMKNEVLSSGAIAGIAVGAAVALGIGIGSCFAVKKCLSGDLCGSSKVIHVETIGPI